MEHPHSFHTNTQVPEICLIAVIGVKWLHISESIHTYKITFHKPRRPSAFAVSFPSQCNKHLILCHASSHLPFHLHSVSGSHLRPSPLPEYRNATRLSASINAYFAELSVRQSLFPCLSSCRLHPLYLTFIICINNIFCRSCVVCWDVNRDAGLHICSWHMPI